MNENKNENKMTSSFSFQISSQWLQRFKKDQSFEFFEGVFYFWNILENWIFPEIVGEMRLLEGKWSAPFFNCLSRVFLACIFSITKRREEHSLISCCQEGGKGKNKNNRIREKIRMAGKGRNMNISPFSFCYP